MEYDLKKAKVEVKVKKEGDALAWADGEKIKQVFLNIIGNACHAMENGGELAIFLSSAAADGVEEPGEDWSRHSVGVVGADNRVLVWIADQGTGIPPESLAEIFEPFFSTKGEGQGTGLGMYISQNILLDHGGGIEVASCPGEGTVFTLHLSAGR